MLGGVIGVLFDGIAYGSLLFLISVGLSVTMGLMNFINLAHGAFAMLGGYVCVVADVAARACRSWRRCRWPSWSPRVAGVVLERTLYRRLYQADPLDQVLFSIGLTFMAVAAATSLFGPTPAAGAAARLAARPGARARLDLGVYRLFLIGVVVWSPRRARLPDRAHPLRRADPRLGRQPDAPPPASASTSSRVFSADLRARLRPGGPGRRPRHRRAGPRSDASRSSTWCTSCWWSPSAAPAPSRAPLVAALILGVFDVAGKYYVPRGRRLRHLRADGGAADRCSRPACTARRA